MNLPWVDPFLAQCLRVSELHEGGRRGPRQELLGKITPQLGFDLITMAQGPIADAQQVVSTCNDLRNQVVHTASPRLGHPLHPTRHRPVEAVEHLASTRIDHRRDRPVAMTQREGKQVER